MKNDRIKKGMLFALLAAVISGISIFYNKLVIIRGFDPLTFNIIKNGGVAMILTPYLLRGSQFTKGRKIPWAKLWLIGIVGGSIPFILFFQGLTVVSATAANLIQKTLFIWVGILAIPFLKEKLQPVQIIGFLLVIYANFFIGGLTGLSYTVFEGMILLATVFWSIENIIAKRTLNDTDSHVVAWGRMTFGTIVLIIAAFVLGKSDELFKLSAYQIMPILPSVILLTLYVLSWYKALKLAPVTSVAAILILATPITNLLTAIFINHNLRILTFNTTTIILGAVLISLGWRWQTKTAV